MTSGNTKRFPTYIGGIFAIIAGFFFITLPAQPEIEVVEAEVID